MDAARFDRLTRVFTTLTLRRRPLVAALLALPLARTDTAVAAGPGCTRVGKPCQNKGDCCSNVCRGKKGKKRCKAHDTGGCKPGESEDFCGGIDVPCTTSAGLPGFCNTTTGNAGYCAREGDCNLTCSKDSQCQKLLGAGAACVNCAVCFAGRACASPNDIP